jgi:hypothetical protein
MLLLFCQTKSLHGNIFGDMVTQLVKRRPEFVTLALKVLVLLYSTIEAYLCFVLMYWRCSGLILILWRFLFFFKAFTFRVSNSKSRL